MSNPISNLTKIESLRPQDLNCNIFSVYDYDACTIQELLCQFFDAINKCIDVSNATFKLAEWLVNEGLAQEVAKKLELWLVDGTLKDIINEVIFKELNDKLNANIIKTNRIEKIVTGAIQISLADFGFNYGDYLNYSIEKAISSISSNDKFEIILPNGKHKTKRPIVLDRRFTLVGNNTTIIADYDNWEGNDYDCIQFKITTPVATPDEVIDNFNKRFENINLDSIGASKKPNTRGIHVFSEGLDGATVNRSLNSCKFKNVMIRNFEYGLVLNQCFSSDFSALDIVQTRHAILIEGQSVNLTFDGVKTSNHRRDFNNLPTKSIEIKMNNLNEKPEGIMINNCLFFGADYGVVLANGYFATINNTIIDWCSIAGVYETGFRNYNIDNSYIACYPPVGTKGACVQADHVYDSSQTDPCSCRITNTSFFGGNRDCVGINFGVDYSHKIGYTMSVDNCDFDSLQYIIFSSKIAPANSYFTNLRALNISQMGVNVQGGLWDCLFDNITINNEVPIIDLRPNFISGSVRLGFCKSNTYATYFKGSAEIQAGQTEVMLPNGLFNSEIGMDSITNILNQYSIPSFRIIEEANWSQAKIVFSSPVDKTYKIRYEASVIKSTL